MFERIMGLEVIDHDLYQQYRLYMTPILASYGGRFIYDFAVSEVFISKTDNAINRVFAIEFPERETMHRFFSDREYLKVKAKYLDHSIGSKTVISMYETLDKPL